MKKMTKKLVMSFLSLGFAIVALGTTTFAWFTATASVTASNIKVNVSSADTGILISWDAATFSSTLDYTTTAQTISPVTRTADSTFKDVKGVTTTAGYLTLPIYFMSQTGGVASVKFNNVTVAATGAEEYLIVKAFDHDADSDGATSKKQGDKVTVSAANALRLETRVYEVGQAYGLTEFGDYGNQKIYSFEDSNAEGFTNFGQNVKSTAAANAYYAALMGINAPGSEDDIYNATPMANTESINGLSLTDASEIFKVDFIFYLEGLDADCFDAIGAQGLTINLGFSAVKA